MDNISYKSYASRKSRASRSPSGSYISTFSHSTYKNSPETFNSQSPYRASGYFFLRREEYLRSLKAFDIALTEAPNDVKALIGRALAGAKAAQTHEALEDINKVLKVESDNLSRLADKAAITYLANEFEEAAVQYYRLCSIRKKSKVFTHGAMHCSNTIKNGVGECAGHPLRDYFKIIRKIAWKRHFAEERGTRHAPTSKTKHIHRLSLRDDNIGIKQPRRTKHLPLGIKDSLHSKVSLHTQKGGIPPYNHPFPFRPLAHYTTNLSTFMAEKYLDRMYRDKVFLKEVLKDSGMHSPNPASTRKLKEIARSCHDSVNRRQEMLRSRRPFYNIKYQESMVGNGNNKERLQMELDHQQYLSKREADALLDKLMKAQEKKQLKDVLATAEKLGRLVDNKPNKIMPNKEMYREAIYETICNAFYDVYRVKETEGQYQQNKRIYFIFGITLSGTASTDSVINELSGTFINHKKKIEEYEDKLVRSANIREICWLYHELARLYLDIRQLNTSRLYAQKCIKDAAYENLPKWIFNSAMLLAKGDVQDHNKNDANRQLKVALQAAIELQDTRKIDFVNLVQHVFENLAMFEQDYGYAKNEHREKNIIEMMASAKLKNEAQHLFRKIASVPVTRRMTFLPGVSNASRQSSAPERNSINPGNSVKLRSRAQSILTDRERNASLIPTFHKKKASRLLTFQQSKGNDALEILEYL